MHTRYLLTVKTESSYFLSSVAFEGSREGLKIVICLLVVFIHVDVPFLTSVCTFR